MAALNFDDIAPAKAVTFDDVAPQKPIGPADMVDWKRVGANLPTWQKAVISSLNGWVPGFGDELAGGATALASRLPGTGDVGKLKFSDVYRGGRDIARGAQESYGKEHPVLSTATEVGIGLSPGSALNTAGQYIAAKIPAKVPAVVKAAIPGGLFGAVSGAGTAPELADVPAGAAWGAGTGAAMSGAVTGVQQGVSGAYNNLIKPRFSQPSALDIAQRRIAESFARDKVDDAQAVLKSLGPEARIVDAGGRNVRSALDLQATLPGQTKEALEQAIRERQAGRAQRLISAADEIMGTRGARLGQTLDDLDRARQAASKPLYDRVRQAVIPVDDELAAILERAKPAFGDAKALANWKGEGFALGEQVPGQIPLTQLDTLKRTLYDKAYASINPETGKLNETGRAINELRKTLVDKLDKMTTDQTGQSFYAAARNAYAGPTELRTAAGLGSQAMSKDGWKIAEITKGMSDSELEAFRVGAMEALRKKAGTEGGQTSLLKFWKEPATSEKLKEIFPSVRLFQEYSQSLTNEGKLKAMESLGRGSQTAERMMGAESQIGELARDIGSLAVKPSGGKMATLFNAARGAYGRAAVPEPVRDKMGEILLSRDPGLLGDVGRLIDQENAKRAAMAGTSGVLSSQLLQMLNR